MGAFTSQPDEVAVLLRGLSKQYQQADTTRLVLKDVEANIHPGEFIAIRGRSGSGKTTLLNLLAGIDEPTQGRIFYGELAFSDLSREQRTIFRRDHIGFVFQFFNLIPTLNVIENVLLPAELSRMDPSDAQDRARSLLDRVGLAHHQSDFPDQLSGGEQQRVALARAVMLKPMVILADEPTGNLDQKTGDEVMHLLDTLRVDTGTTLIMVTHSHSLAERSDRVLLLENGVLKDQSYES
jgi:putative ABC transport system ATP-binding protein